MFFAQDEQNDIEKKVGLKINKIKSMRPHELRDYLSKKTGKKFCIESYFPFIGRGNVLRDEFISREELDADVDAIICKA